MNTQQAYNQWASQYDTNLNRTRDVEGKALRQTLSTIDFERCLEIGCGTGKNTTWLVERAKHITAVDLSENMLAKAKEKVNNTNAQFLQADITTPWHFGTNYNLITFSLVLEHIQDLDPIFERAAEALSPKGHVYIGELHPFKQYTGSKARFETAAGTQVVECYTHHISEFVNIAKRHGLAVRNLNEFFDEDNGEVPRILTLLFQKI